MNASSFKEVLAAWCDLAQRKNVRVARRLLTQLSVPMALTRLGMAASISSGENGDLGLITDDHNEAQPRVACSIGLSRRAPWRTGEPGRLVMDSN